MKRPVIFHIIYLVLLIFIISSLNDSPIIRGYMDTSEYIERNETPKDLGLNVLEIYNYKDMPLIFFDGYHEKGVIYLGDFSDIYPIYDFNTLDFILVKKNTSGKSFSKLYLSEDINFIELHDKDNSLRIVNNDTVFLHLKRFKFIITNQLELNAEIKEYDAQFFVLVDSNTLYEIQESFSVEQIFLIGDHDDSNHSLSAVPKKYFVQFICNDSSYKFQLKQY